MEQFSEDVSDFWVSRNGNVKILENPSALEFMREGVMSYEPVIIRGLINDWPAMKDWNISTICEKLEATSIDKTVNKLTKVNMTPDGYGDCLKSIPRKVDIENLDNANETVDDAQNNTDDCRKSSSSSSSSSNNDRRVKTAHIENDHEESTQISSEDVFVYPLECYMTTQLFKDMILNPHSDDAVPYLSLQNDNLRVDMAELMEDIQPSLEIADEAFGMQQPEAVNLWIGDERSVSSLHKDHFENMYAVISGEKTFTLLPPTDIMYLDEREYPTRKYQLRNKKHPDSVDSDQIVLHDRLKHENLELYESENPSEKIPWISTDPEDPLILIKNPKFKYAHPLRCRVQEGEILYIPAMWFHRVSQTRLTIAVNYWYDQKFDFRYVFYQSVKRFKHEKLGITDDDDDV
eukprot:CAMPEP_0119038594 /NCGR_PEP_ID=MMETSP1177-20130426/7595_1 /TAXON_ID=2985 /ORGANISM="Ochromonas sp, Strain CCMP1899" /LENGTH=404 /DNA_ID=CAMNT_0007001381 /DNA_START=278 /DNA_END=1492 /DNA_ORIENTATION=+